MNAKWSIVAVFLAAVVSHAGEVNLVVNGGFENPEGVQGYRVVSVGSSLGGWTLENGTVELVSANYWHSAEGRQSLDLNGIFDQIGTIYQDIPTAAGQRYRLRFALAGNPAGAPWIKSLRLSWAGKELEELRFDAAGRSFTNMGWEYHEYIVEAAGPASRLRFQSTSASFCGPTLDDISVTPLDQFATSTLPLAPPPRKLPPSTAPISAASVQPNSLASASPLTVAATSTPLVETELALSFYPCLTIKGNVGRTYFIESAEALNAAQWLTLTNFVLPSSPFIWIDTVSTNSGRRFYRAVLTP